MHRIHTSDLAKQRASMNPLATDDPSTSLVAVNTAVLRDVGNQTRDLFTGGSYGI